MQAKIKIKRVFHKDNIGRNGKPYTICSIVAIGKTGEEFWINGFGNNVTRTWKDGQTVELDVNEEEYNGKLSWKFKEPQEISVIEKLETIESKIDKLISLIPTGEVNLSEIKKMAENFGGEVVEKEEVKLSDIPF